MQRQRLRILAHAWYFQGVLFSVARGLEKGRSIRDSSTLKGPQKVGDQDAMVDCSVNQGAFRIALRTSGVPFKRMPRSLVSSDFAQICGL